MGSLAGDVRFALRGLAKRPGFTASALLTLSLGIGANAAVFGVIKAVLLEPLPFPGADRLVMVWTRIPERGIERFAVSPVDFQDWRERNRSFQDAAVFEVRRETFLGSEHPERLAHALVSPGFFDVLGVPPALGRTFRDEENLRGAGAVAVVSHGLWQRALGGRQDVLGSAIDLGGRPLTVVGVMPAGFEFPRAEVQLWVPYGTAPDYDGRGTYTAASVARLRQGVRLEEAQADLDRIMSDLEQEHPGINAGIEARVDPLHEMAVGSSRPILLMLWGTVGLVLIIVCANVANLLLARHGARRQEMAIRAALGAGRGRLVRQLLTESLLLAALGGAAGVLAAHWGVQWLPTLSAGSIPRLAEVTVDRGVLGFTFLLSLGTGVLFGLLPALRTARGGVNRDLKEGTQVVSTRTVPWLRGGLAIAEVAVALMVLVGAGLLGRSMARVLREDPGFRSQGLLSFRIEPQRHVTYRGQDPGDYDREVFAELAKIRSFYDELLERARALPGVESASAVSFRPLAGTFYFVRLAFHGRPQPPVNEMPVAQVRVVTPGYFQDLGIPLLAGRYPDEGDGPGARRIVVVNETLARRHWPEESAVGSRLSTTGDPADWNTVVGVVGDVRQDLAREPMPLVYVPLAQGRRGFHKNWGMDILLRTTGEPLGLAGPVRELVAAMDRDLPVFRIRTMEQIVDAAAAGRRFTVLLVGAFAALALLLAALGTYSVLAQSVELRSREIGIRMALGAGRRAILRLVLGQGLLLTFAGLAAGVAAAYFLTRFLRSLLYQVSATDPWTFAGGVVLLGAIGLLACYLPARRATRVDPIDALRHE